MTYIPIDHSYNIYNNNYLKTSQKKKIIIYKENYFQSKHVVEFLPKLKIMIYFNHYIVI